MKYIIGLFIAVVGFILASQHLDQGIHVYWDFVAFSVVILGTCAIMLVTFPAAPADMLFKRFWQKFLFGGTSLKNHLAKCLRTYQSRKVDGKPSTIEEHLLHDGLEMMALGFNLDQVREVLSQRFETHAKRLNLLAAWLKRGSKYPPAFGLAGTVLGLIHLMRGISEGIDPKETGLRMAIALVATFYGLLISNLLLNPLGEWLLEEVKRDEVKAEASLRTIQLIVEDSGVVHAHEMLSSFLGTGEKIAGDILTQASEETA